jgi:DnaJ-class molecular chaperone
MADRNELLSQLERIIKKGDGNYSTSLRKVLEIFRLEPQFGEWQLCPKCDGFGQLLKGATAIPYTVTCPVCNGAKVLARPIINDKTV